MRIIFMGTPRFAVAPLQALAGAGHEIAGVVTRIDKPAGRGKILTPPPVKEAALALGLSVLQPRRVREPEFVKTLRDLAPAVVVVAAYGQILPKDILTLPRFGCINIHASLLPRYRGAAPINWSIIRGEEETGNTIMLMDEGMDTGAILTQERILIDQKDTAGTLTEKLSLLGARMIVEALPLIEAGKITPKEQDHAKATLAPLLKKEDGSIDWVQPAAVIHNRVRGMNPWPGASTFLDGRMIKIIETAAIPGSGEAGVLIEKGKNILVVGTGEGLLEVHVLQPEGKKPMTAAEFLRGQRGVVGKKFEMRKNP